MLGWFCRTTLGDEVSRAELPCLVHHSAEVRRRVR